jgi:hypothetical protein
VRPSLEPARTLVDRPKRGSRERSMAALGRSNRARRRAKHEKLSTFYDTNRKHRMAAHRPPPGVLPQRPGWPEKPRLNEAAGPCKSDSIGLNRTQSDWIGVVKKISPQTAYDQRGQTVFEQDQEAGSAGDSNRQGRCIVPWSAPNTGCSLEASPYHKRTGRARLPRNLCASPPFEPVAERRPHPLR